jgi:hypothetical protein
MQQIKRIAGLAAVGGQRTWIEQSESIERI